MTSEKTIKKFLGDLVDGKRKYTVKNVMQYDPDIVISMGGRNIGKSYQLKCECCLRNVWEKGGDYKFCTIRRYREEIKQSLQELYFESKGNKKFIRSLTNGEWEGVTCYRDRWYWYRMDGGKKVRSTDYIGYVMALANSSHYRSLSFEDANFILEDEIFPDDGLYINDEPGRLYSIYSTIKRDREDVILFMSGNTINRVNPYFHAWNLEELTKNQRQGEINVYEVHFGEYDENGRPKYKRVVVEFCEETDTPEGVDVKSIKTTVKSSAVNMSVTGKWQRKCYPKLDKKIARELPPLYFIIFTYNEFRFRLKFIRYGASYAWYVKAMGKGDYSIDKDINRAVGNVYDFNRIWTMKFSPMSPEESKMFDFIKNGNVVFDEDLTGEDFYNCMKQLGKLTNIGV